MSAAKTRKPFSGRPTTRFLTFWGSWWGSLYGEGAGPELCQGPKRTSLKRPRLTARHTRLKTLPSCNFASGGKKALNWILLTKLSLIVLVFLPLLVANGPYFLGWLSFFNEASHSCRAYNKNGKTATTQGFLGLQEWFANTIVPIQ